MAGRRVQAAGHPRCWPSFLTSHSPGTSHAGEQALYAANSRVLTGLIMVRFPQLPLITWGLHSHLVWEEPSVEGMVTLGMESSPVLFWGCQSLLYRLPRE